MQKAVWIDLTAYGGRLQLMQVPSRGRYLVVTLGAEHQDLRRLGFSWWPRSNVWGKASETLKIDDWQKLFPAALVHELPLNEIRLTPRFVHSAKSGRTDRTNFQTAQGAVSNAAEVSLMQVSQLGRNFRGDQVMEGVDGRFIRLDDQTTMEGSSDLSRAAFLRASLEDPDELSLCADGFVLDMDVGRQRKSFQDLVKFGRVIAGELGADDPRFRQVQEAIEASIVRRISKEGDLSRDAFDLAVRLNDNQPTMKARTSSSVALQQYSTPGPMAVAAQWLLDTERLPATGIRLLDPTIGNGSLVSLSPAAKVLGFDLDTNRLERVARMLGDVGEVHAGDARAVELPEHEASIVNPPFGGLDQPIIRNGLRLSRVDQLILFRTLAARTPSGRTVAIIAGDSYKSASAGEVTAASRYLFNWIADHYHLEGVIEVDGRLYNRQGAGYPVRLLSIGDRRDTPLPGEGVRSVPSKLSVIKDWDALWTWASSLRDQRQTAPAPEVSPAPVPAKRTELRASNTYQTPYVPFSRVSEPEAMIPKNLAAGTRAALARIEDEYGAIDQYVGDELGVAQDELGKFWSAEQVDALALALAKISAGEAFVVADQTGFGKGRILAGLARAAMRKGMPVHFVTEKANLFSDFWRDLCDTGSAGLAGQPLILNDATGILDTITGEVLVPATPKQVRDAALSSGTMPTDAMLSMSTYSQFNSEEGRKADWLERVAHGCLLLLDESHNAAGDSNTATNIAAAASGAAAVGYSSATFAKDAKNLVAYAPLFPQSVNAMELPEILRLGGEPMMETLSGMLAERGNMIRREHDLSGVTFCSHIDDQRLERNRHLCDQLSPILSAMAFLSGDVNKFVSAIKKENRKSLKNVPEADRKGARLQVTTFNVISRLYNISRQFSLALKTEFTVEKTLEALAAGRKPTIVLENTMASLLDEITQDLAPDEPVGLQFRDLLKVMAQRLLTITERTGYGAPTIREISDPDTLNAHKTLMDMIEEFPDLPLSPIDTIREAITNAGYRCDEISGRSRMLVGDRLVERTQVPRTSIVAGYNSGQIDALVLTRAGSTGISLHASEKFADQRQRELLELQIAANVAERMQFWGRINRKGQVSRPMISMLSSGLVCELRELAMQNTKLRKLSANVTSNRESSALDTDVPDILNVVGDEVCREILESRPELAHRLAIEMPEDKPDGQDLWYVNKLLSRLILLRSDEQEELWESEISAAYDAKLNEYALRGEDPFKAQDLGKARVTQRILFEGAQVDTDDPFEGPIYVSTLEIEKDAKPLRSDFLQEAIQAGWRHLSDTTKLPADEAMPALTKRIRQNSMQVLRRVLPERFETVDQALADEKPNAVKATYNRLAALVTHLPDIVPGAGISITGNEGVIEHHVVIRVEAPQKGREHNAGAWTIRFAAPGSDRVRALSLYALINDPNFECTGPVRSLHEFDTAPAGTIIERREVLDGNLFDAARLSHQHRLGKVVTYEDDQGLRRRCILVPKKAGPVAELPVELRSAEMVREFLTDHPEGELVDTLQSRTGEGLRIVWYGGHARLLCPGATEKGGRYFADANLVAITGEWAGSRALMSVNLNDLDKLPEVADLLFSRGNRLYCAPEFRAWLNEYKSRNVQVLGRHCRNSDSDDETDLSPNMSAR